VEYSMYRRTTSLGEQYGNQFESSMIVRGAEGQSEAAKKLENLFADVKKNENIDDAIHELSLYWELSQMETYNDYTDYSSEIGWNLAIAYLKDNNKKEAKKVLEKLIATSEEGSAIYNTSTQLLEKL
jgi:predicted Zn-dependent protease